jgi:hypothetical protein
VTATRRFEAVTAEETFGWLLQPGKACRVLEAQIESEPSTLVLKVQESPELWPEQSARAGTPVVIHDQIRQVGRSAGRQVGKSASRQVGRSHHPARERSSATIGLGSPGRRCLPRAATGYQRTPRADYRKFGADSMGAGNLSLRSFFD